MSKPRPLGGLAASRGSSIVAASQPHQGENTVSSRVRPSSLTRLLSFVSRLFVDRRHRRGVTAVAAVVFIGAADAIGVVTVAVHSLAGCAGGGGGGRTSSKSYIVKHSKQALLH